MREGFIYVAHADLPHIGSRIKVGFSKDPHVRVKALSDSRAVAVVLLCYAPGTLLYEKALHQILKSSQCHGEWYKPGVRLQKIISYIGEFSELPKWVIEAGEVYSQMVLAKRSWNKALRFDCVEKAKEMSVPCGVTPLPRKASDSELCWLPSEMQKKINCARKAFATGWRP